MFRLKQMEIARQSLPKLFPEPKKENKWTPESRNRRTAASIHQKETLPLFTSLHPLETLLLFTKDVINQEEVSQAKVKQDESQSTAFMP